MTFAQDNSKTGQVAQHWKLRMMAEEAALEDFADGRTRRLLAYDMSFTCADIKIGEAALVFKSANKENMRRRRGPALILGVAATGVTAKFQSHTFNVARICLWGKVEA